LAIPVSRIVTFDLLSWLVTILAYKVTPRDTSANDFLNPYLRRRNNCLVDLREKYPHSFLPPGMKRAASSG